MRLSNGEVLFSWPLSSHVLTAGWYYSDGSLHRAIDFEASVGTPVFAAEDGIVTSAYHWNGKVTSGDSNSYGNYVIIEHRDYKNKPLRTLYAHLDRMLVRVGDTVKEGSIIGYSGATGNVTGPHLHFEVRYNGIRVNPLNWLDSDFTCKYSYVRLGPYHSVETPASDSAERRQIITVKNITRGDYEALCEKLVIMGKTYSPLFTIETEPLTQAEANRIYNECVKRELTNGNYSSRWEV